MQVDIQLTDMLILSYDCGAARVRPIPFGDERWNDR